MALLEQFVDLVNKDTACIGDMLEFGTGHGHSTEVLAKHFSKGNIYTFDGFRGLPKTNKVIPKGTGWHEGALQSNEANTRSRLQMFENVFVHRCMTWELKSPKEYGITEVSCVNLDLDLYEGTVDALAFLDRCAWSTVYLRFDDWGFYRNTSQVESEVDEHEKAAFYEFVADRKYEYKLFTELNSLTDNRQAIIKVMR